MAIDMLSYAIGAKSGGGGGGGSAGSMLVGWAKDPEANRLVLSATWKEIHDAIAAGTLVIFNATEVETVSTSTGSTLITGATEYEGSYYINTGSSDFYFDVDGENDYPYYSFD